MDVFYSLLENKKKMAAGYSKTPLLKKLGIKENFTLKLFNQPANYFELLDVQAGELNIIENKSTEKVDFIHHFGVAAKQFSSDLNSLQSQIKADGMIWVSWNKTKSKLEGELNENLIRQCALSMDLVDIKVCAVDSKWSGSKLVIRKEKRKK